MKKGGFPLKRGFKLAILTSFFLILVLSINSIYAFECYQESVNVSNQNGTDGDCNLNYSGSFVVEDYFFYVNYTKPINVLNSSLWKVKFSDATPIEENVSILKSCWDYDSTNIQLRFYSFADYTNPIAHSIGSCYDGAWKNITTLSTIGSGSVGGNFLQPTLMNDGDWSTKAGYMETPNDRWGSITGTASSYANLYEEAMIWNYTESNVPNLTIIKPKGRYTYLTIPYNVTTEEDTGLDTCIYWVTLSTGASHIGNQTLTCGTEMNGTFNVASDDTNYLFWFWLNDTSGNSNITNQSFSTISGAVVLGSGSGGGTPKEEKLRQIENVCLQFRDAYFLTWEKTSGEATLQRLKTMWIPFWDYALCGSASSIVPI